MTSEYFQKIDLSQPFMKCCMEHNLLCIVAWCMLFCCILDELMGCKWTYSIHSLLVSIAELSGFHKYDPTQVNEADVVH